MNEAERSELELLKLRQESLGRQFASLAKEIEALESRLALSHKTKTAPQPIAPVPAIPIPAEQKEKAIQPINPATTTPRSSRSKMASGRKSQRPVSRM